MGEMKKKMMIIVGIGGFIASNIICVLGEESVVTGFRYNRLLFPIFSKDFLIVILGQSSLSLSTIVGTNKDMAALVLSR